jgi:hypothetical protein
VLRTCAVQRLLSTRLAWQIRWGSCALVENEAHRLLECLTDSHTVLDVLRRDCWCGRYSYHHSARQYYHYGATSWAVCRCSLRPVNQQRHQTLTLRCRRRFSASDSIATPKRYFARSYSRIAFVSAAGSCRSRQPLLVLLPIKQRMLHAHRHLCDGCVQSSLLMRSILGNRGHVTTSDSSVHAAQHAPAGEA